MKIKPTPNSAAEFTCYLNGGVETVFGVVAAEDKNTVSLYKVEGFEFAGLSLFRRHVLDVSENSPESAFQKRVLVSLEIDVPDLAKKAANLRTIRELLEFAFENNLPLSCEGAEEGEFILGIVADLKEGAVTLNAISGSGEVREIKEPLSFEEISCVNLFSPYETSVARFVFGEIGKITI